MEAAAGGCGPPRALKVWRAGADMGQMQITVACHHCEHPKRPLSPCPTCAAAPLAEAELHAWRVSLHAHHLARITDEPRPTPLPARPVRLATPLRLELLLDAHTLLQLAEPVAPEPIAVPGLDPALPPRDDAKSFDWGDDGGWLRRSA